MAATAASAAATTSKTFWLWFEEHHIDALAVLVATLWITVRIVEWALDFAYTAPITVSGAERAGIIAAVMTPWGLMQGALFKFYADLKAKTKTTNGVSDGQSGKGA